MDAQFLKIIIPGSQDSQITSFKYFLFKFYVSLYLKIKIRKKMKIFRHAKELLINADLFHSAQMLRYKSQAEYKTMTGGIISLCTIIAVIIGFSSMIISTMERTSISSKLQVKKTGDPPYMQLTGGKDNFMFGLFVQTLDVTTTFDLLKGPQIFDIKMLEVIIQNGVDIQRNPLNLVPCTRDHWAMEQAVVKNYQNYQVQKWLCPKINQKYQLSGIYGSKFFSYLQFSIYPCTNSTLNNNKCAPQSQIDHIFANKTNFYLTLSYINAVMNPNQVQYIKYYYESQNYIIFSKNIGNELWVYLSDFTIQSDNSILPYKQKQTQKGYIGEQLGSKFSFQVSSADDNRLASIFFAKSRNSLVYSRQVLKISEVISYVGGLISALASLLFIVKVYTDTSFQINICSEIFYEQPKKNESNNENEKQDISKGGSQKDILRQNAVKFNFKTFIFLYLYKMLKIFKKGDSFRDSQRMLEYQAEINKQLDIRILLNRILKMELFISQFFKEQNIKFVKNYKEITCQKAKELRMLLSSQESRMNSNNQIQNISQQNDANQFNSQSKSPNNLLIQEISANNIISPQLFQTQHLTYTKHFQNIHEQSMKEPHSIILNDKYLIFDSKTEKKTKIPKETNINLQDRVLMKQLKIQKESQCIQLSAKDIIKLDKIGL